MEAFGGGEPVGGGSGTEALGASDFGVGMSLDGLVGEGVFGGKYGGGASGFDGSRCGGLPAEGVDGCTGFGGGETFGGLGVGF